MLFRQIRNKELKTPFNSLFHIPTFIGGGKRVRTADPLRARQVLSQLSYTPTDTYPLL